MEIWREGEMVRRRDGDIEIWRYGEMERILRDVDMEPCRDRDRDTDT